LVASSAGVSHFSASARTGDVSLSDAGNFMGVRTATVPVVYNAVPISCVPYVSSHAVSNFGVPLSAGSGKTFEAIYVGEGASNICCDGHVQPVCVVTSPPLLVSTKRAEATETSPLDFLATTALTTAGKGWQVSTAMSMADLRGAS
jgi:hypothetical protein